MNQIISEIVNGNYTSFSTLSNNFEENFTSDNILNGRWAEHIFRLSAYLKLPTFVETVGDSYSLFGERSIFFKSGTKATGKSDAILINDLSVILVSCKWGKFQGRDAYDVSKLRDQAFTEFPNHTHKFGFAGIDPHYSDENEISFDYDFFSKCWSDLWAFLEENSFDFKYIDEKLKGRIVLKYKKHQIEAIKKAKTVFESHRDCLFFHSPRTGKTVTALGTAKSLNCKKILWLTPLPSINYQITDTINNFDKFQNWTYFDYNDSFSTGDFNSANVIVCSFQRLDDIDHYSQLFDVDWDMVIIDEVHTHSETNNNQDVIENLKSDKILWLSATPFKNIALGRFHSDNTHKFTNTELYELRKTSKSYANYPKINYVLYSSNALIKLVKDASKFYKDEEWFSFTKLFEINNDNRFVYENQVKEFIDAFFINQYNRMGLRSMEIFQQTKSILLFVPNTACQELLTNMMNDLFKSFRLDNIYSVDYTNSKINNGKSLKNWIETNTRKAKPINIVIACDQLSCGVTLPECDMVVMWNDSKSESDYIQRAERCKNPKNNVENVYVVDFNPHRCLQSHGAQIEADTAKPIHVESTVDYLQHMNIMLYDDSEKFRSIDPTYIVDKYNIVHYPLASFERLKSNELVDSKFVNLINKVTGLKESKNIEITKLDEELSREDGIQNTTREFESQKEDKPIDADKIEELKKKIAKFKKSIPWFCIISKFKHNNMDDIIDSIVK